MINAVGREIPEEILKETGKQAFQGAYAFDGYDEIGTAVSGRRKVAGREIA